MLKLLGYGCPDNKPHAAYRDVEDSFFVSMMNWEYGCLGWVQMEALEHEEDVAFCLAMKRHYCDLRQRDVEDSLFVSMMNWEYGCQEWVQMEAPEHKEDIAWIGNTPWPLG